MRRSSLLPIGLLALFHAYAAWRLLPDLHLPLAWPLAAAIALLLSLLLIPAVLLRQAAEGGLRDHLLIWCGLLAAGWFSTLFVLTLLRDLALVLMLMLPTGDLTQLTVWSARAVLGLSILASLLGLINARRIARVVDVQVPIQDLPPALHGFTIAQITDLHVGPTIRKRYVDGVVDKVNSLEADMIAVTGDLVDGSVAVLAPHTHPLSRLRARHGAFLVTGNHEYYSHAPSWIAEFRRLGLQVLLNEHVVLSHEGELVVVGGVTDYTAHHFVAGHKSDPHRALHGAPQDASFKLLLAHQPRSAPAAEDAGFHLQLSGHTHGGQFLPWNLFVPLQQPYTAGLNRLQALWIYTSRGTGYWGPPKRLGAPSEITRLRLVPA